MELVLRSKQNGTDYELCIDHQDDTIGFTVLNKEGMQVDFSLTLDKWKQLHNFLDDSIREYNYSKKDKA